MTNTLRETVVARLTPLGTSALATIGIFGPAANEIVRKLFRGRDPGTARTDRPLYGDFGGAVVDDVVLRVCELAPTPRVEVHCHGGLALVDALMTQIEAAGARRVAWTDYLRLQGSDEIQVEAADALSRCLTARCAAILLDQHQGALRAAFEQIERDRDGDLAASLLQWDTFGSHLVQPWRVLLYGRANVGKSCLLNALSGFERAIVMPEPGTTRDLLSATVALEGWPVELLDGAGLRDAPGPIEARGQQLIYEELRAVDLRVLVFDTAGPIEPLERQLLTDTHPEVIVGNKCDLPTVWTAADLTVLNLRVSAVTGEGVAELGRLIANTLVPRIPPPGQAVPFTPRQVAWVRDSLNRPNS